MDVVAAPLPDTGPADLRAEDLHASLNDVVFDAMTFLNEVAQRFPDAISFAAGRPHELFLDLGEVSGHLDHFAAHLRRHLGDEALVRRTILQYGRTKGIIHDLVARHLEVDEGITADPEALVITVGFQEALYLVLRALRRDSRDVLLVAPPNYVGANGAARLADMALFPVPGGGADAAALAAAVREARAAGLRPRACYLVPDFNNPTGESLSVEARHALLRTAEEYGILLIEDNPYGLLRPGPDHPPTLKALDRHRRVVYIGSFAKTAVPGARVGYVLADQTISRATAAPALFADELAKIKSMVSVNTSPIAQAVIGGTLLACDFSLRAANVRQAGVYRANLAHLLSGLAARFPAGADRGVRWTAPDGGFFVVVDVPFPADDRAAADCARDHGVLWTPIHHFHGDGRPRPQLRLSVSQLTFAEIDAGLDRLAAFIRERGAGGGPG